MVLKTILNAAQLPAVAYVYRKVDGTSLVYKDSKMRHYNLLICALLLSSYV